MSVPLLLFGRLLALKVIILAGGGEPAENHHSHSVHVRGLADLLMQRGVPPADITVFWADGRDPAPDRAVRETPPHPDDWIIVGTTLDKPTQAPPPLRDTQFPDLTVHPARRDALQRHLAALGPTLTDQDTLLFAVTDHGQADPDGRDNTSITLWGESWSTRELLDDLAPVPTTSRVLLWMSQCHSGGFARLAGERENLCGVFSATPDRLAYGCYPDLAERSDVGHFRRMLEALVRSVDLSSAHDLVLVSDDTPDTPHLTSDAFLFDTLTAYIEKRTGSTEWIVDSRLREAPADAPERALIGRVAYRYGLGLVRRMSDVTELLSELHHNRYTLEQWSAAWTQALDHERQLLAEPLTRKVGEPRGDAARRARREKAIGWMLTALRKHEGLEARVRGIARRAAIADRLLHRMDLYDAATVRLDFLFARLVGPAVLDAPGRRHLAALHACERSPILSLPADPPPERAAYPAPLPLLHGLPAEIEGLRPGFVGVSFRDRPNHKGIVVERVELDSPTYDSALRVGDQVLSVNGWTLSRRGDFRESVRLARPGDHARLKIRRGRERLEVEIPVAPLPLPVRPAEIGGVVGELGISPLDEATPLPPIGEGQPVILFYWATYCRPCKASIPALLAFAAERDALVVGITRERGKDVRRYVTTNGALPFAIALDPDGEAHRLLGVDGTPVYALIDGAARLLDIGEGFDEEIPLRRAPAAH